MQRFNDRVTLDTGSTVRWVAFPVVHVFDSGTSNPSVLFADDGITPLANPFTGDAQGWVYFYAADGKYDVVYTGGTPIAGYTVAAVLLDDTLSLVPTTPGILSLNGLTIDTQGLSVGLSGSDFNIASYGSGHTFNLPIANSVTTGKLSSSDWLDFHNRLRSINGLTTADQLIAIGSAGSSPNIVSGGATHTINLPGASATKSGILSNTDWTTFNNKQAAITTGTNLQYFRGDLSLATLQSDIVPEGGTNLYYTNARARAALSATSPVLYNPATGVISANAATGAQNGYLTSADWNTFNNKLGSLNGLVTATQTFSTDGSSGTDFAIASAGSTHVFKLPSASASNRGVVTTGPQFINGPKTWQSEAYFQQYIEMSKRTEDLTNAGANQVRIYLRDNGAGKMQLVAIFPSGALQQLAIEP